MFWFSMSANLLWKYFVTQQEMFWLWICWRLATQELHTHSSLLFVLSIKGTDKYNCSKAIMLSLLFRWYYLHWWLIWAVLYLCWGERWGKLHASLDPILLQNNMKTLDKVVLMHQWLCLKGKYICLSTNMRYFLEYFHLMILYAFPLLYLTEKYIVHFHHIYLKVRSAYKMCKYSIYSC